MSAPLAVVAGASGVIGSEVVRELQARGVRVRALVREPARLSTEPEEIFVGNLLNPRTLLGVCDGADAVVSCAGAPLAPPKLFAARGETFHAVNDLGARALLREAETAGVRRFASVSLYAGRFLGMMECVRAHESFAAALLDSQTQPLVVRCAPTFARVAELVERARKRGRLSVPGTGQAKTNPIHERDAAIALVDALESRARELDAGGPDALTQQEIAEMAAEAAGGVPLRFTRLWGAQGRASLRRFAGRHSRDAALYRLAESEVDVVAPVAGKRRLRDYFGGMGGG